MTKEEYGQVRDTFLAALRGLQDVAAEFHELASEFGSDLEDTAYDLDRIGTWLTGEEFAAVERMTALLERLVGRAHERAV